jgi:uncharacterized membrane protein YjgN (DUF898 family)
LKPPDSDPNQTELKNQDSSGHLEWSGKGFELLKIVLVNVLLRVITLGIYHFWAKTRTRNYVWSHVGYNGDRFEYTGDGKDLFIGFLKALLATAIVAGITFGINWGLQFPSVTIITNLIFFVFVYFLVGVGMYGARRYLLSHTRWRSIRFGLAGSTIEYGWRFLLHSILLVPTFFLYYPFMQNYLRTYTINHTWFGTEKFSYEGSAWDYFGTFFLCILLFPFTVSLSYYWYQARVMRYVADQVTLGDVTFSMDCSGFDVLGLKMVNAFLLSISFGLAYPWVVSRKINFLKRHLTIHGELDYSSVGQSAQAVPETGEGLIEVFGNNVSLLGLISI